jgi:hypothetical protein
MNAINKTEQSQGSQSQKSNLDNRYGKIGISAVAAALYAIGDRPPETASRLVPYDRD